MACLVNSIQRNLRTNLGSQQCANALLDLDNPLPFNSNLRVWTSMSWKERKEKRSDFVSTVLAAPANRMS
jgi:hypothetical protein